MLTRKPFQSFSLSVVFFRLYGKTRKELTLLYLNILIYILYNMYIYTILYSSPVLFPFILIERLKDWKDWLATSLYINTLQIHTFLSVRLKGKIQWIWCAGARQILVKSGFRILEKRAIRYQTVDFWGKYPCNRLLTHLKTKLTNSQVHLL